MMANSSAGPAWPRRATSSPAKPPTVAASSPSYPSETALVFSWSTDHSEVRLTCPCEGDAGGRLGACPVEVPQSCVAAPGAPGRPRPASGSVSSAGAPSPRLGMGGGASGAWSLSSHSSSKTHARTGSRGACEPPPRSKAAAAAGPKSGGPSTEVRTLVALSGPSPAAPVDSIAAVAIAAAALVSASEQSSPVSAKWESAAAPARGGADPLPPPPGAAASAARPASRSITMPACACSARTMVSVRADTISSAAPAAPSAVSRARADARDREAQRGSTARGEETDCHAPADTPEPDVEALPGARPPASFPAATPARSCSGAAGVKCGVASTAPPWAMAWCASAADGGSATHTVPRLWLPAVRPHCGVGAESARGTMSGPTAASPPGSQPAGSSTSSSPPVLQVPAPPPPVPVPPDHPVLPVGEETERSAARAAASARASEASWDSSCSSSAASSDISSRPPRDAAAASRASPHAADAR
eukprot:scaffold4161_cov101-Isochrysis_galbana.AAC.6